ncbi:MAG TPA: molybdopterin biosynthesis protein MoeY [Gammaproteobacteria bacterium]|nr:molybdopterin biosynthesis protein MoeY [Gammaproteobacteria bacterium]
MSSSAAATVTRIEQVLDSARWAPSGDNVQSWRFQLSGPDSAFVHGFDTRDHCVYDLDGRASWLALGTLMATLTVAAAEQGCRVQSERIPDTPETHPSFHVRLIADGTVRPSPWFAAVRTRCVQRRAMSRSPLSAEERAALAQAAGPGFSLHWKTSPGERFDLARLLFLSAHIRLTTPECYEVHRRIIDWDRRESETAIPDAATGLDPLMLRAMRWTLGDFSRVEFMNRWLAGTLAPRVQLDVIPALCCAGHFLLVPDRAPETDEDWLAAGAAWQRLWLEAERRGLSSQPEMTPLIFARYHREGRTFSRVAAARATAARVDARLAELFGSDASERAVVLARIGRGPRPTARSVRRPLAALLVARAEEVPGHPGSEATVNPS